MVEKYGVNPEQIETRGMGENQPIADNTSEQGRAQNRRVILIIPKAEFTPSEVVAPDNTQARSDEKPMIEFKATGIYTPSSLKLVDITSR